MFSKSMIVRPGGRDAVIISASLALLSVVILSLVTAQPSATASTNIIQEAPTTTTTTHNHNNNHNHNQSKLAKLFDYENYKRTFGKSYATELEDSARRCYFYARALAAFVSGVGYKYRHAHYYKALNEMSDWTPEERAKTMNKAKRLDKEGDTSLSAGEIVESEAAAAAGAEEPLAFMPAKGENAEETLRKFLEEHAHEQPLYRELLDQLVVEHQQGSPPAGEQTSADPGTGHRRRKRTINSSESARPRDFSFDLLIHSGVETSSSSSAAAGEQRRTRAGPVRSNNPNYEGFELETRGLDEQLQEVDFVSLAEVGASVERGALEKQLEQSLGWLERGADEPSSSSSSSSSGVESDMEESDVAFVDHRRSGCLSEVRSQGVCGCCYAFASIALAEWLYCRKTGRLVAFSEQYMVDCGKGRFDTMLGCNGATDNAVVEFIHNFGLELRSQYPYRGREGKCPYDDPTKMSDGSNGTTSTSIDLSSTGYIRMELGGFVEIPASLWERALRLTPLYVRIEMDESFLDYGGGVYDGAQCRQVAAGEEDDDEDGENYHSMLLVGHGRQDGQEYWLIRNSHGKNWGERGYYKLSKAAPRGCIPRQVAYAFGASGTGASVRTNELYAESIVAGAKTPQRQPAARKRKTRKRY